MHDEHVPNDPRDTGMLRSQSGSLTTSVGMGAVPSTSDASGSANWGSDAPAAEVDWSEHDDAHYRRFRDAHQRALDDDYASWRRERSAARGAPARDSDAEPRDEGVVESVGRAVSETVIGAPHSERPDR